jgi:hypothetical protein
MSNWPLMPAGDALLFMNEAAGHPRLRRRRAKRRAIEQRLSRVSLQIEHGPECKASLQRVAELEEVFQRGLGAPQRERWLALEDALLDHASLLYRAYFEAGVEYGQSSSSGRPKTPARDELDADAVAALARLIIKLVGR